MSNKVFFKSEAAQGMKKGIDTGTDAVCVTLGYGGRTVFISKRGFPTEATKDGVTVITSIRLKDPLEDAGLKFIQDISSKTADVVGDGTTTVCVLTREMITQGLMLMASGINIVDLKRGMERAAGSIYKTIDSMKKDVGSNRSLLRQIATVSANNDKAIGDIVGTVFDKIGRYGIIRVEDGKTNDTTVEVIPGFQFLGGYTTDHFINTKENTCELENPYVLIVDGMIDKAAHIRPILEKVVIEKRALVIMADDYDNEVIALVLTNMNGAAKLKCSLISHAFIGETKNELLRDLCAITGATLITPKTGKKIENIDLSSLGECEKITSSKEETTIVNGKSNQKAMSLRIHDANKKIEKSKNPFVKERYETRLAKLTGSIAVCYVGGATEVEVGERKHRIDDAIRATKAAIEEGVVPGGGTTLLRCIEEISKLKSDNESEMAGIKLIQKSIEKPFRQICYNAGSNGELLIEKVKGKKGNIGYNAKTNKIEDLFKAGIIDPAKVVRVCIEKSVSGSIQFLMSECAIVDEIIS